jgi:hypothetical protein
MQRKAKLVRKTPMKRRSKKQAKRLSLYKPIRENYLKENSECAAKMKDGTRLDGCRFFATQVHHGKGRMGDLLFDENYFIPVCDGPCHKWLEENPQAAKEIGLSLKRLD